MGGFSPIFGAVFPVLRNLILSLRRITYEQETIQSDTRLKVILPMEALTVKEIHNIYCPHCRQSVFGSIPESQWEFNGNELTITYTEEV